MARAPGSQGRGGRSRAPGGGGRNVDLEADFQEMRRELQQLKKRAKTGTDFFLSWPAGFILPAGILDTVEYKGLKWCNGDAIARASYPELFEAIDVDWGAGDGSTTFNVPNLKNRVLVGRNSALSWCWNLGQGGGLDAVALVIAEMPNHRHAYAEMGGGATNQAGVVRSSTWDNVKLMDSLSQGGDGLHENLQPYKVVNYFITLGRA